MAPKASQHGAFGSPSKLCALSCSLTALSITASSSLVDPLRKARSAWDSRLRSSGAGSKLSSTTKPCLRARCVVCSSSRFFSATSRK
eukprot:2238852-Pleurochrysis_carterae.AAC.2